MKAALNGGLNLSIRDGWWDEWYDGRNGWAIPSAENLSPETRDELEAAALYELIETQVAPRFYDRDPDGLPKVWIEMVKHTLRSLGPKVLASRMVCDYVDTLYAPSAASAHALNADYDGARELAEWKRRVNDQWPEVRVDHLESVGADDYHELGSPLRLRVFVSLGGLTPSDVDVQVVSGRVDDADELRDPQVTSLTSAESYENGRYRYEGVVPLDRTGAFGYTVRVLPKHKGMANATEMGLVANA
jgi:starch phosphorylase